MQYAFYCSLPVGNRTCGDSLNGDVRLVGGSTEYEGRVELCLDGEWGTICDNFWSNLDAAVVCTQLTHGPTDSESFNGAYFGQGTGPIHLDRLFCSGDEERLTDCIHAPVLPRQCGHDQDVGVRCSGKAINLCSLLRKLPSITIIVFEYTKPWWLMNQLHHQTAPVYLLCCLAPISCC